MNSSSSPAPSPASPEVRNGVFASPNQTAEMDPTSIALPVVHPPGADIPATRLAYVRLQHHVASGLAEFLPPLVIFVPESPGLCISELT